MKQNLHTHSTYCDGKSTIKEMIRYALYKDFDLLGFSGHSYTSFDESYCMSKESVEKYIKEIRDASDRFKKSPEDAADFFGLSGSQKPLRILLGLEQDLYSDEPAVRKQQGILNPGSPGGIYDYIIGSTHAFRLDLEKPDLKKREGPDIDGLIFSDEGLYIYVDYGAEAMEWAVENVFGGDPQALAEAYFRDEARIVEKTDCDIVGHFDLLLKFNEKEKMFDENSSRYREARDAALRRIFSDFRMMKRRPVFEVNTGAMAKGYRSIPYPMPDTLKLIREMGGQAVINSDCHMADKLDYAFDEAKYVLNWAGFREEIIDTPYGTLEIYV